MGTSLLGLAFIFGESLKDLWENFVFIFFVRPFDVGDKITIQDNIVYPVLTIHKISLLVTEAHTYDGRLFLLPNTLLRAKVIISHKRSKNFTVTCQIQAGFDTKREQIEKLEKRLKKWLKSDTSAWNYHEMSFNVTNLENANKLTIDLSVELKGVTHQAGGTAPRGRLFLQIHHLLKELGIQYFLPTQPVSLLKKVE